MHSFRSCNLHRQTVHEAHVLHVRGLFIVFLMDGKRSMQDLVQLMIWHTDIQYVFVLILMTECYGKVRMKYVT